MRESTRIMIFLFVNILYSVCMARTRVKEPIFFKGFSVGAAEHGGFSPMALRRACAKPAHGIAHGVLPYGRIFPDP